MTALFIYEGDPDLAGRKRRPFRDATRYNAFLEPLQVADVIGRGRMPPPHDPSDMYAIRFLRGLNVPDDAPTIAGFAATQRKSTPPSAPAFERV